MSSKFWTLIAAVTCGIGAAVTHDSSLYIGGLVLGCTCMVLHEIEELKNGPKNDGNN